jgi:hypothetical protein
MGFNGGALEECWPRVFRRAKYTKSRERPGGDVESGDIQLAVHQRLGAERLALMV